MKIDPFFRRIKCGNTQKVLISTIPGPVANLQILTVLFYSEFRELGELRIY